MYVMFNNARLLVSDLNVRNPSTRPIFLSTDQLNLIIRLSVDDIMQLIRVIGALESGHNNRISICSQELFIATVLLTVA